MRDGSHGNAEQVVDFLILKQRADDRHAAAFPPLAPEQLEAELLKGDAESASPVGAGRISQTG